MANFSQGSLIGKAWDVVKPQQWFWVGIALMTFLISYLLGKYFGGPATVSTGYTWRFPIIQMVVNSFVSLGVLTLGLKASSGAAVEFADFYSRFQRWPTYFVANIIFAFFTVIGLVIFIVPGVIFATTYGMYGYAILDKEAGILQSFRMSADLTKGYRWDLFVFFLLLILINIAGAILIGVGLLWTLPISMVAMALAYRRLGELHTEKKPEARK